MNGSRPSAIRMGSFFLAAALAVAFGDTVKYTALQSLERSFENKLASNPGKYPFEVLANAPAIYVPGIGVTVTTIVNLVYTTQESPFRPAPTPEEWATVRQHKLDKIPVLEQNMREFLADAAASPALDAVRPTEQLSIGVSLFYFPKEDVTGLPRQITMSAFKQKLLEARRNKVDLATVIMEQKL